MMKLKCYIFSIILVYAAITCGCKKDENVRGIDVTKTNVINIAAEEGTDYVATLSLHFRGYLEGSAIIVGSHWKTNYLTGTVDYKIDHDWFSKSCTFYYYPLDVKTGNLSVAYAFK